MITILLVWYKIDANRYNVMHILYSWSRGQRHLQYVGGINLQHSIGF